MDELFVFYKNTLNHTIMQIISIRLEYLKPHNCVQTNDYKQLKVQF